MGWLLLTFYVRWEYILGHHTFTGKLIAYIFHVRSTIAVVMLGNGVTVLIFFIIDQVLDPSYNGPVRI